jgi:hypothetical protein
MEKWPNFFIVGAPRAGTTSLYEYLKQTKGIFMPSIKDPDFFAVETDLDFAVLKQIKDKKEYLKLFENVKDEIAIGEASPTYLHDPKAPKLIHDAVPNAKIIISLRDPVERANSYFSNLVSSGTASESFSDCIRNGINLSSGYSAQVVKGSFYYEQVKKYLEIFGKEQVKIIIFEEFVKNTRDGLIEIFDFLGIKSQPPEISEKIFNPTRKPRGKVLEKIIKNQALRKIAKETLPRSSTSTLKTIFGKKTEKEPISNKDKRLLEDLYRDDVKNLERLLERTLPWELVK